MACTEKFELIDLTLKEHAKLDKLIAPLEEAQALIADDETSIKDVIAHRAHWIDLFLGWYKDGMAGKQVYFPAEGYKWNDLKRYNADLRKKQAHLSWEEARGLLQSKHYALIEFLTQTSNGDLYSGPMQGAHNKWTPGRWAEAAGASHYRSASKYIRSVLRKKA